ncbi:hypothetical protein [Cellulomonas edaphi]|uniref:PE domain-containing protein n=1 Tax=Cellulomonas edaphi TaxID=3053468 RepID=A0ABT7S3M6_9CELL|nr:hypothetical protein [Cellulomons edaphi]MDM7830222.1 hypothetical protein [Cellulomons edaphi]
MGDGLAVDTAGLREAGAALRAVAEEFDAANAHSEAVADAVGDADLAAAVRDLAHGWDDRRAEMVQDIAWLARACEAIGEGFENLDRAFAAALRGGS